MADKLVWLITIGANEPIDGTSKSYMDFLKITRSQAYLFGSWIDT